jgi:hypothetical protein
MAQVKACSTLFFDDFSGIAPGAPGSAWTFFSSPPLLPKANDAAGGVTSGPNGLQINSTPFTFTAPNGVDHVKYLVYSTPYTAPDSGELVYEAKLSVKQTGLDGLPDILKAATPDSVQGVNNVNSDARLSTAGMVTIDPATLIVFDFFLTNEDIYALYERLPFLRTEWGGPGPNYTAFTHLIPVGKRNTADPLSDFVVLAIKYNKSKGYVTWWINGVKVFEVSRIGLPLERKYRVLEETVPGRQMDPAKVITPQSLQFGFGTFSIMDATNPQNPGQLSNDGLVDLTQGTFPYANPIVTNVDGTSIAAKFISHYPLPPPAHGTNFGQGSILDVKYARISIQ